MKVLNILLDDESPYDSVRNRAGTMPPGYYSVGDSHARAVGAGSPWDHTQSFNGASSKEEDFGKNIAEYVPSGSVVVISLGANDAVKNPKDSPETIAARVKSVVDTSNSRKNKTFLLLFPAGPKDSKLYQRRADVRNAIEKAVGQSAKKWDLDGSPLRQDGVHAEFSVYSGIANQIVKDNPLDGFKKTTDTKTDVKKDTDVPAKKDTDTTKPSEVSRVSGVAPINGKLIVNSPYGKHASGMHYGVDLAASSGTPVRSPISGSIIKAGEEGVCGGSITVRTADGKEQHRFCHLKKFNVSVGQEVKAGDVIALSGGDKGDPMKGNSTGAHLHWEKKLNGSLVDPMTTQSTPNGQGAKVGPSTGVKSSSATVSMSSVSDYLKSKGMDDNHRRGILANIQGESSFTPGVLIKDVNGLPSGGLFQHNGPRYDAMTKAVPDWQTNWQGQVDYALNEPAGRAYLSTPFTNVGDAIAYWLSKFEVTKDPLGDLAKRTNFANSIAESIN